MQYYSHAGVLGNTEHSDCESPHGSPPVASLPIQTEESKSSNADTLSVQTA